MSDKKKTSQPTLEDLQSQLDAAQLAVQSAEEAHKRALADYQNLQQRAAQERQQIIALACKDLLADLLPTLDHLEMALQHFQDPSLKLVASELEKTLKSHGLVKIATVGQVFDPNLMEAVDTAPGQKDVVIGQHRAGYQLGTVVLRHAQVIVGIGQDGQTENATKNQPSTN